MTDPRVSCILPVWNGQEYVAEAIRSVLAQSFRQFELIIVDDGSTDETADVIRGLERQDERIRLVRQQHGGVVSALNRGLALAAGEYIARMDADDVCASERFELQAKFLDRHPDVGVCGSWVETIDGARRAVIRYSSDDGTIRSRLLFESALAHPSVMLRRAVLERHGLAYDAKALHAEDYDLWVRAAPHTRFANIPAALVRYRVHPRQVGHRHESEQGLSSRQIQLAQLRGLGIRPTEEEANLHCALSRWRFDSTTGSLPATRAWLSKLMYANAVAQRYPQHAFLNVLGERWAGVCAAATCRGLSTLVEFWRAPQLARPALDGRGHVKFGVKCLIRKRAGASLRTVDHGAH